MWLRAKWLRGASVTVTPATVCPEWPHHSNTGGAITTLDVGTLGWPHGKTPTVPEKRGLLVEHSSGGEIWAKNNCIDLEAPDENGWLQGVSSSQFDIVSQFLAIYF